MSKFTIHVTFEGDSPTELHHAANALMTLLGLPQRLACIEASIERGFKHIMATLEETKARLEALTTAVDAEHEQAAVVLQEVVDLKAQIASLLAQQGGATPTDLDALNTSIDSILEKVKGIIPDAPVPAPTA